MPMCCLCRINLDQDVGWSLESSSSEKEITPPWIYFLSEACGGRLPLLTPPMCDCVSGAGAPDPEGAADPQSRATEEGGGAAEGGLFPLPVFLLRTLHLPVTHHWNPTALGRLRPRSDQIRRRCDFSKGSRLGCGRTQLEESHRFGL